MTTWQSQLHPPVPNTAAKYWANVADILSKSNYSNPAVNTRLMGDNTGVPVEWQPPLTRGPQDL